MNREQRRYAIKAISSRLQHVARHGTKAGIYIGFLTQQAQMPDWLKAEHPEMLVIVLQHSFYSLKVSDEQFSVQLTFGGRPAELLVPFSAVFQWIDHDAGVMIQMPSKDPAPAQEPEPEPEPDDGKVVSLDSFRKNST